MFLKKSSFILKGALLYVAALLLACNSDSSKEDAINTLVSDTTAFGSDMEPESYSLPSPLQIASIFKKSGLKYKDGVTSPMKDPSKYITSLDKALNLGVYSADMSYTVLNKQNQESITYMNLSRQLADKLGMSKIFEEKDLAKRFNKNLGNKDSLIALISELQLVTDIYLDQNNQQQITSIVFSGAWIESLYIASKVFEHENEQAFVNKFSKQMSILGSIINSLKAVEKKTLQLPG